MSWNVIHFRNTVPRVPAKSSRIIRRGHRAQASGTFATPQIMVDGTAII
jgi:hypothetical protein